MYNIIVLSITGLFLVMIGAMRLSNPRKGYASGSGIQLEKEVNILNEARGISAVMLCAGLIIITGAIHSQMSFTSFTVAILIYLGFALGRIISVNADGKPNPKIIQGILFELVFGGLNVFGLVMMM